MEGMISMICKGGKKMEEHQKGFLAWVKDHKKQLIIAGISVTTLIGIILGLKKEDAIMELWMGLEKNIKKDSRAIPAEVLIAQFSVPDLDTIVVHRPYTSPQTPFDVTQHIRTLSGGRQHSAEKEAEAAMLGIVLLPNQTLVDSYTKFVA